MWNKVIVALALLVGVVPVQGTPITFYFGGIIDTIDDPYGALDGSIQVGGPFSGSYTFDPPIPDSYPNDPEFGRYISSSSSMEFIMGNMVIDVVGEQLEIAIGNYKWSDSYSWGGWGFVYEDMEILELYMSLSDLSASVFDSDALPLMIPDLNVFNGKQFHLDADKTGVGRSSVYGTVTYLVPEPVTMIFYLCGSMTLLWKKRN